MFVISFAYKSDTNGNITNCADIKVFNNSEHLESPHTYIIFILYQCDDNKHTSKHLLKHSINTDL